MPADRPTFTVDITGPALLGDDLRSALNALPEDLKVELAQTVMRVLQMRLVVVDRIDGKMVSRPSPLFVAFADFVDRLVDEIEAGREG